MTEHESPETLSHQLILAVSLIVIVLKRIVGAKNLGPFHGNAITTITEVCFRASMLCVKLALRVFGKNMYLVKSLPKIWHLS